jgi:hypothetical protein
MELMILKRDLIGFIPSVMPGWSCSNGDVVVIVWQVSKGIYAYNITNIDTGDQAKGWIDTIFDAIEATTPKGVIVEYLLKHHQLRVAFA